MSTVLDLPASAIDTAPGDPFEGDPFEEGVAAVGKRVYLRTLRPADLPHLEGWASDPFLQEMVGSELLDDFVHVYRRSPAFLDALRADRSQINLAIVHRGCQRPLGVVRLFNVHRHDGYAFLETIVADARALRLGYGIEASKLIAYWAIDVLKLRRLEAKVYPWNVLSINTMKRRHWRLEGELREAVYRDGEYRNLPVFGSLAHEIALNKLDDDWTPIYYTVPDWT